MEEITIQDVLCSQCNSEITSLETKFCTHCGFPENGDEKEKAVYHANKVMKKSQAKSDEKKIKSARNTLYWIAGIFFVFGVFSYLVSPDNAVLLTSTIIAIIYIVLAYWSQQKPFAALLSGLLLYLMIIAVNVVLEPVSIFSGIIVKIIILSFLIKGVYAASERSKN